MKYLNFTKMSGAGNDFILVDNRDGTLRGPARLARRLTDRRRSVGADGLIFLENSGKAAVRMRIFNPDGSEAPMCGNGIRCLARFAWDNKFTSSQFTVETLAGIYGVWVNGKKVRAHMISPKNIRLGLTVLANGKRHTLHAIDTGVPHVVEFVRSPLDDHEVNTLGRALRFHPKFAPRGTNVDFVRLSGPDRLDVRTYERGVETETWACGTGVVASALVAVLVHKLRSPVRVRTRGGESLKVSFSRAGSDFQEVVLEGRIQKCFEGRIEL